jgi:hypothetical protein
VSIKESLKRDGARTGGRQHGTAASFEKDQQIQRSKAPTKTLAAAEAAQWGTGLTGERRFRSLPKPIFLAHALSTSLKGCPISRYGLI